MADHYSVTYGGAFNMIKASHHRAITRDDLVPLEPYLAAESLMKRYWKFLARHKRRERERQRRKNRGASEEEKKKKNVAIITAPHAKTVVIEEEEEEDPYHTATDLLPTGYSLFYTNVRFLLPHMRVVVLLATIRVLGIALQTYSLGIIVQYSAGLLDWHLGWAVCFAILLAIGSFVQSQGQHGMLHTGYVNGCRARALCASLLYRKIAQHTALALGHVIGGGNAASEQKQPRQQKEIKTQQATTPAKQVNGRTTPTEPTANDNDNEMKEKDEPEEERVSAGAAPLAAPDVKVLPAPEPHPQPASDKEKKPMAVTSSGRLINLVATDTNSMVECFTLFLFLFSAPFELAMAFIWIGVLIGWAAACTLAVAAVIIPLQFFLGSRVAVQKRISAALGDARLKALGEFLAGIQIVKLCAWEPSIIEKVGKLRGAEEKMLIRGTVWKLLSVLMTFFVPGLLAIVTFGVVNIYNTSMEPSVTFIVINLLNVLSRTFFMTPRAINALGTALASARRMEEFLKGDVHSQLPVPTDDNRAPSVSGNEPIDEAGNEHNEPLPSAIKHQEHDRNFFSSGKKSKKLKIKGDFGWDAFALRDVDVCARPGTLTVIVGPVGSGKSTLLQAMLRECAALSSSYVHEVPISQGVAYVSQEAWIEDKTLRENIVFGAEFDEKKYLDVLWACALAEDLNQWGGDLVEVGEKGLTLSGGQRQRIAMARACYADAGIYLLDDPISAVDATVGRHLLYECILNYLVSRGKTVILVTHHAAPRMKADTIVALSAEGRQVFRGDYEEFLEFESRFQLLEELPDTESPSDTEPTAAEEPGESTTEPVEGSFATSEGNKSNSSSKKDDKGHPPRVVLSTRCDASVKKLLGVGRIIHKTEDSVVGGVGKGVYVGYIRAGGTCTFILALMFFILAQAVRSAADWWFSAWTARKYPSLSNNDYILIELGLVLGTILFGIIRTVLFGYFTVHASSSLHNGMFRAVLYSPMHFFEQVPLGRILNRFGKDVDNCDEFLPRNMFDFMQQVLTSIGAIAVLIVAVYWFAIAVVVALIIFGLLLWLYIPSSRYMKRIEGASRSPSVQVLQGTLYGLPTIRAMGHMARYESEFLRTLDITTNTIVNSDMCQRWVGVRMDWIAVFWVTCVALLCVLLGSDRIPPSLVGLALSQSLSLTSILQYGVRMAAETESLMTSAERIMEYAALPPEDNTGTLAAARLSKKQWPQGAIDVRDLTLAHVSNPDVPVLRDLSFTIGCGERVAVVGRTGAGKSTLLSAFFRLLPIPPGSITIDGVDSTELDVYFLRSRLGIIPQAPTLFLGTVRYNLDPFHLYEDAEMLAVLDKVRLGTFVAQRQGLDTSVGESGSSLSIGQKQLLCAARALLRHPHILFLDEATANVDSATDAEFQEVVREECRRTGMTVITIAHRLDTIMDYDKVIVLDKGRLAECGRPQELALKEGGLFYSMVNAQHVISEEKQHNHEDKKAI